MSYEDYDYFAWGYTDGKSEQRIIVPIFAQVPGGLMVNVECNGVHHQVFFSEKGKISLLNHDWEAEEILLKMGGKPQPCLVVAYILIEACMNKAHLSGFPLWVQFIFDKRSERTLERRAEKFHYHHDLLEDRTYNLPISDDVSLRVKKIVRQQLASELIVRMILKELDCYLSTYCFTNDSPYVSLFAYSTEIKQECLYFPSNWIRNVYPNYMTDDGFFIAENTGTTLTILKLNNSGRYYLAHRMI